MTSRPSEGGQLASGYFGVHAHRSRWVARIDLPTGALTFGGFLTPRDAAITRDRVVLHMGLDQPLSEPRASRKLGPLSPEEARIEAKIRRRGGHESKYFGVTYDSTHDKWCASCRRMRVASLETELEAALAHDRLALALGARDEPRNFPDLPLKPATAEELRRERRARLKQRTASAFMHVRFNRKVQLWIARAPHDGRQVDLGRYRDEEDAALAVDRALLHWGDPPVNLPRRARNLGPLAPELVHEEAYRQIKATKSSRFRGVFWNSRTQSWSAQVMHRYRSRHLGFFADEMKAAAAYDVAAMKLHQHRAKLNFPAPGARRGPSADHRTD